MIKVKRLSIESFLVVLLMIILAIAMSVIILKGSQNFELMLKEKNQTEDFRIAISYLNMMIKKNDSAGSISLVENFAQGRTALKIKHKGDETGLATYIYSVDQQLYEQYGEDNDIADLDLATEIITASVDFQQDGQMIKANYLTDFGQNYQQIITLKSKVD